MLDQFATCRNMAGQVGNEPSQGIYVLLALFLRKYRPQKLLKLFDGGSGISEKSAVGAPGHARPLDDVVLVFNFADNLFNQVFDRDKAVDATELIYDQRE